MLFIWVVSRGTWLSIRAARQESLASESSVIKRIVAASMCAIALNTIFGMTFGLYSVAPLAWMFMGWVSAETSRVRTEPEREVIEI